MKIKLAKNEIVHFIGIGGIGMSGLAIIMQGMGFKIQGSDTTTSRNIDRLNQKKIKLFIGHRKKNLDKSTIVVISSAIKNNNPEYIEAKKKALPIYKRGEMLGQIVSLMKNVVVAGSHGKTTTTSLISSIFSQARLDPTIINGGVLNSYNNSAKLGKSDWCILESDESDGSFLNIPISYSIITNIDNEHLDFYKSLKNLKKNFLKFIEKTPPFGKSLICLDDKINSSIIRYIKNKNYLTYGTNKKSNFRIENINENVEFSKFNIVINLPGKKKYILRNVQIPNFGIHNIRNATAAVGITYLIGISNSMIKQGLRNFQGVQRRYNHIFNYRKSIFIDDYAHHPTEIRTVLNGIANVYKKKKIYCIFQPHRISRLKYLKDQFAGCFEKADYLILCPIFKAGEKFKLNFEYKKFAKQIIDKSNVNLIMIKDENDLLKYVKQNVYGENIVIGMGAGSISNWIRNLPIKLK